MERQGRQGSEVELSERSTTIVLPPLSRYARPESGNDDSEERDGPSRGGERRANGSAVQPARGQGWLRRKLAPPQSVGASERAAASAPGAREPDASRAAQPRDDAASTRPAADPVTTTGRMEADAPPAPGSADEATASVDAPRRAREHEGERPSRGLSAAAAERRATASDPPPRSESMVAVPTVLPRPTREPPRTPFWQRIALPLQKGLGRRAESLDLETDLQPIVDRLEALERLLADGQKATVGQLEGLEEQIEALSLLTARIDLAEVRERMALLEAAQMELADGLHAVARNLALLVVAIALAVAGGALALGFLL